MTSFENEKSDDPIVIGTTVEEVIATERVQKPEEAQSSTVLDFALDAALEF